jgi:glycosyltransferase involved in cell wall biosynthesis
MSVKPVVSIITPTFNHGKFIFQCIESVLNQTFQSWEMIIVNDGSSDETEEVVLKFAEKDKRIKYHYQSNKGIQRLNETYNFALEKSQGELVCILEGDDYWEHDKLEFQVNILQNNPKLVLTYGKAHGIIDGTNRIMRTYPQNVIGKESHYNNRPLGSFFNIIYDDFTVPVTYMIRKRYLHKIGGFIQVLPFPAVDLSTFLALSEEGDFSFQDRILGYWRISPNQTTKTFPMEILEGSQKIISDHLHSLPPEIKQHITITDDVIKKEYKKRIIVVHARNGRIQLIKKEFRNARKSFLKALTSHGFTHISWKLRALIGLVMSYLKLDMEFIAEYFGKGRFN